MIDLVLMGSVTVQLYQQSFSVAAVGEVQSQDPFGGYVTLGVEAHWPPTNPHAVVISDHLTPH